jgi:hypothetical protein
MIVSQPHLGCPCAASMIADTTLHLHIKDELNEGDKEEERVNPSHQPQ